MWWAMGLVGRRSAGRLVWMEHDECPRGPDPQRRAETFAFVTFQHPAWQLADRAAVEDLVGQAMSASWQQRQRE
jgi:hypothetical protein